MARRNYRRERERERGNTIDVDNIPPRIFLHVTEPPPPPDADAFVKFFPSFLFSFRFIIEPYRTVPVWFRLTHMTVDPGFKCRFVYISEISYEVSRAPPPRSVLLPPL